MERYALPSVAGDETPNSVVVHFAGQYGGARSLDGRLPVGMLVQYIHLVTKYHLQFLDRLMRKAVSDKELLEGRRRIRGRHRAGPLNGAMTAGTTSEAAAAAAAAAVVAEAKSEKERGQEAERKEKEQSGGAGGPGSMRGGLGRRRRGRHSAGPMTVQDSVALLGADWTRSIRDVRHRLVSLAGERAASMDGHSLRID